MSTSFGRRSLYCHYSVAYSIYCERSPWIVRQPFSWDDASNMQELIHKSKWFYSCMHFHSLDLWWMTWIAEIRTEIFTRLTFFVFYHFGFVCSKQRKKAPPNIETTTKNNEWEESRKRKKNRLEMIKHRETNIEFLLVILTETKMRRENWDEKKIITRTSSHIPFIPFEMSMNWVFNFDAWAQWW